MSNIAKEEARKLICEMRRLSVDYLGQRIKKNSLNRKIAVFNVHILS